MVNSGVDGVAADAEGALAKIRVAAVKTAISNRTTRLLTLIPCAVTRLFPRLKLSQKSSG
jgi:hypothetical protein